MKDLATIFRLALAAGFFAGTISFAAENADSGSTEALEFFELKIRPLLVQNCYKCHSAGSEKLKGGLLLDTRDGLLKGGDTGPAVTPGDPEKSLLIKAVRYADENLAMPPKGKKLSAEQIADLENWVKLGVPYPPSPAVTVSANNPPLSDPKSVRTHWAFQPISSPAVPQVKNTRWAQTPIDAFVLAKLEKNGLHPTIPADRRTLIRRATFDLTGLPPAPGEVEAFLADESPDAFATVIDRLLASPQYGERWGRYWLDVARYADTKGYVFEEERRFPYSYTYRDYVIRALNEDLPYDRFLIEQIAADDLSLGDDKRSLAALGFLTLGRRFLNNQPDIIDDRIDVVCRGTMALTVGCARCHDHKYDPIPTKDYYSLYGVFASSREPDEKPLLGAAALPPAYPEYLAERKKREDELNNFRASKSNEALSQVRQKTGEYLLAAYDAQHQADKSQTEALARERKLDPGVTRRWIEALDKWSKGPHSVLEPWFQFAALETNDFALRAKELAQKITQTPNPTINPLVAQLFTTNAPASMKELAEAYGKLFADVERAWQDLSKPSTNSVGSSETNNSPKKIDGLPDLNQEALRQILYVNDAPSIVPEGEIMRLFDVPTAQKVRALRRNLEELDATHPGAAPRAMALVDNETPTNPHVFVRGNPNNPGPEVLRRFLEVIAGADPKPFQHGSGRLELAQAIASPDNPLTARVIVNRIWLHHFGAGLVRTPSDFGLRSEPPSHPELLDYLAGRFAREGWSMKGLHRLIMLSSVYQQSSDENPAYAQIDANNTLLWHFKRQRLDFESTRDTLLAVSGKLDLTEGGHPVDITTAPFPSRRTIYGFVERQNLPGLFRTFDFASPDTTSPQRFNTTVPQQALFLLNSPFIVRQACSLAQRAEVRSQADTPGKIKTLYQLAYQRAPIYDELAMGQRFLATQTNAPLREIPPPVWQYGFGTINELTKQTSFQPLPFFTNGAWQGGEKLPDPNLGWVMLNKDGGHPGNDSQHMAIRRWTAPRDGFITVDGTLKHESDAGDGVRGRLISSRQGQLGEWLAHNGKQTAKIEKIEIQRGETLDFVTDCYNSIENDSFSWAPTIKMTKAATGSTFATDYEWNAKTDFSGPKEPVRPLTPWEKYAQILLMSNELVFVD